MPQESGIAAVIPGREPQQTDPMKMMEFIVRMKEAKKQSANEDLQAVMKQIESGAPVDPKTLERVTREWEKEMGPVIKGARATSGITAQSSSSTTTDQGKAIQAVGQAGSQPSGVQSATPVGKQTAKDHPAGGVEPNMQGGNQFENYINQIKRMQEYKNQAAEQKAKTDLSIENLRSQAAGGDKGALNNLQNMGVIAFNKELDRQSRMSPEDLAKEDTSLHEQAMGLETSQQKEARRNSFVINLVSNGYTPEQASKEFEKPGSSGVVKSFKQLQEEVDYYHSLQDSFGDEAAKKIADGMARGAKLTDLLPDVGKTQSHFAQQMAAQQQQHQDAMDLQKQQLKVDQGRLSAENRRIDIEEKTGTERMGMLTEKIQIEMDKAENAGFRQNFLDLIQAAKGGVKIPKEVQDKFVQDLAKRVGLTKTEVGGWLGYLSFGLLGPGSDVYSPDIDKGKKVLDEVGVTGNQPISADMMSTRASQKKANEKGYEDQIDKQLRKKRTQAAGESSSDTNNMQLQQFLKVLGTTMPKMKP